MGSSCCGSSTKDEDPWNDRWEIGSRLVGFSIILSLAALSVALVILYGYSAGDAAIECISGCEPWTWVSFVVVCCCLLLVGCVRV